MNALWEKHSRLLKWAALLLPCIVVLWAVAIEHPPLAGLGAGLAAVALWVMKRQGSLTP